MSSWGLPDMRPDVSDCATHGRHWCVDCADSFIEPAADRTATNAFFDFFKQLIALFVVNELRHPSYASGCEK
ncbi:hypothetical protein [Paraburkholderia sp. BL21I4N1]|uniref:hypothetical protein n=1 Tax=Paraburkholderia sp. BL21I4N1 TaxID=1938801 RepID=UPI0011B26505|nr:hypothetical protein [Paraburkholderia sp. BL21I4N1]